MCQPRDTLLPGVIDLVTEPEIMPRGMEEDLCEAEGFEIGRRRRGLWDLDIISWPRRAMFREGRLQHLDGKCGCSLLGSPIGLTGGSNYVVGSIIEQSLGHGKELDRSV